jgi:glycosyltransferase involved in cell wall biosynthesis
MPELSIVLPSYNHAAFIAAAVRSVLTQTYRDFELIVVDDGSTDRTLSILGRFNDARMRILTQDNRGAHAAINRGLGEAAGRYLAILNSDDMLHPRRFETLVPILKENPRLGLVSSYVEVVDGSGRSLGVKHGYHDLEPWLLDEPSRSFRATDDLRAALLTENYLATTSNYLFTRRSHARAGAFLPLRFAHDWDFALRLARHTEVALVPEPLIKYRVHGSNTITQDHRAMIFEICWILAVYLPQCTSTEWFTALAPADRTDRLLHSMYTFRCEAVLAAMLAQRLADDPRRAEALLRPDDPERARYLEFIARRLELEAPPALRRAERSLRGPLLWRFGNRARRLCAGKHART